ncbi:DUF5345 family protein [Neobacillus sp. D3-1R]|uniref:DUF5345 family protein n=1 Tax=Neobacillus sp. D3-1R TaxID=3445778 RepID=UPI003FA0ED08
MKKSKVIPLKIDQQIEIDETLKQISHGLDSLNSLPFETPSQKWIENLVLEQKQKAKEKWKKEILLFSLIAVFILSGIIISLYQMPIIFIILQGIGISFVVIYSMMNFVKKVRGYE